MMKLITTFCLTLSLSGFSSLHAANVPQQKSTATYERSALIEKALKQKQQEKSNLASQHRFDSEFDRLPMSAKIKLSPSQSILAAQNLSFSRFVQSLFGLNS